MGHQPLRAKGILPQRDSQKLLAKGATPDEVDETLGRLETESYIDEARYARAFVNDKFRFDHWGRIKIRYALRQRVYQTSTPTMPWP